MSHPINDQLKDRAIENVEEVIAKGNLIFSQKAKEKLIAQELERLMEREA